MDRDLVEFTCLDALLARKDGMSPFGGFPRHVDRAAVGRDAVCRLDDDRIARVKLEDCEAMPVAERNRIDRQRRRRSLD